MNCRRKRVKYPENITREQIKRLEIREKKVTIDERETNRSEQRNYQIELEKNL